MNWFTKMFNSSIGQKLIMALTGLFLCSFLIIHMVGNLQLFKADSGLAFNRYAAFMTTNPLIKTVSYLLYFSVLFHAFKGIWLVMRNKKARPIQYDMVDGKANSHWASRSMGLLGTIILIFIVIHMTNFWAEYKFGHVPYTRYSENLMSGEISVESMPATYTQKDKIKEENKLETKDIIVKDLYKEVSVEFKEEWWLVALYVLSMAALSFHLIHGFKSAFQTLGINHKKYNGLIHFIGIWFFGIIIPISFAAMPLYFMFK